MVSSPGEMPTRSKTGGNGGGKQLWKTVTKKLKTIKAMPQKVLVVRKGYKDRMIKQRCDMMVWWYGGSVWGLLPAASVCVCLLWLSSYSWRSFRKWKASHTEPQTITAPPPPSPPQTHAHAYPSSSPQTQLSSQTVFCNFCTYLFVTHVFCNNQSAMAGIAKEPKETLAPKIQFLFNSCVVFLYCDKVNTLN